MAATVEEFRQLALGYWEQIRAADNEAAGRTTDASDALVAKWRAEERLHPVLGPLLTDPDEKVRYAAASYLLADGDLAAVRVLEDLADNASSLVAPTARLLLLQHRR